MQGCFDLALAAHQFAERLRVILHLTGHVLTLKERGRALSILAFENLVALARPRLIAALPDGGRIRGCRRPAPVRTAQGRHPVEQRDAVDGPDRAGASATLLPATHVRSPASPPVSHHVLLRVDCYFRFVHVMCIQRAPDTLLRGDLPYSRRLEASSNGLFDRRVTEYVLMRAAYGREAEVVAARDFQPAC